MAKLILSLCVAILFAFQTRVIAAAQMLIQDEAQLQTTGQQLQYQQTIAPTVSSGDTGLINNDLDNPSLNDTGLSEMGLNHTGLNHTGLNHTGLNHTGLNHTGLNYTGLGDSVLDEEVELPKFKKRALQKLSFSGGWLGATSRDDLSTTFAYAGATFGMPLGSMDNILAVTPSFRCDWVNANSAIDIPSELFDVGIDIFHTRKINDRWKALGMVRPSHRSDFKTTENAVKVFGLGLLIWDYKPEVLSLSFGAVYLGRSDITALPAVGLTWTPNKQNRFELQFPRSRAWHRLRKNGAVSELWSYACVGIGGNTWAVTRSGGIADEVALRDVRITFGIERLLAGGGGWFAETGLALDRSLEYLSNSASKVSLSNGVLLSAGWTY